MLILYSPLEGFGIRFRWSGLRGPPGAEASRAAGTCCFLLWLHSLVLSDGSGIRGQARFVTC
jgi:hypothetical protein